MMGHSKLPWEIQDRWHIVTTEEERFVGSTGGIQDSSRDPVELTEEKEANANLIITAVNVMPEIKTFLRGAQAGGSMRKRTIEKRASELLEKLEAVE